MSDYVLADRAEEALVEILTTPVRTALDLAITDPTPCWPGKNYTEKAAPGVICSCEIGDEETKYTANFWVTATISVRVPAATQPGQTTTKTGALDLLSEVHNAIYVDDLAAQLTAAVTELHVFTGSVSRLGGNRNQDAAATVWEDTIELRFLACAADLS